MPKTLIFFGKNWYKNKITINNIIGDIMKKVIFIILILVGIISFIFIIDNSNSNEVRIRILSNSNSEIDKREKQIVKDALEEVLNETDNLNIVVIKEKLVKKLKGKIKNEIKVERVNSYYPAKSYDNRFIPSGSYDTILVTIGSGKGNNFWTLLYPEFYNIEFEEENEIEYRVYFIDLIKRILA